MAPTFAPPKATPPPEPVAVPPAPSPLPLESLWLRLLALLPKAEAVPIHDVAFPVELTPAGVLRVGLRKEQWRLRVREALGQVDLGAAIPGARRVDIVFEAGAGRTGRERIAEADADRRAAARAAAEACEPIRKLIRLFDADMEEVHPVLPTDAHEVPVVEESADDYAAPGGTDG